MTVNGESYTEAGILSSPQSDSKTYRFSNSYGYDVLSLGGGSFKADENNEIIICAEGYRTLMIEYNEIPEQIIREQNRLQWTKLKHHFTEIIEISFLKEDILRVNIWMRLQV